MTKLEDTPFENSQIILVFCSLNRIFAPIEQIYTKMETPLVSFILTYYNLPVSMLRECIDSLLSLTLRPFEREIIIVDDGSDASPINELLSYGNDIIYIRQHHQGLSVARNTGIQMARGTYMQFIDADDKLLQVPYEQCLDIVRYQNPDLVLFHLTSNAVVPVTIQSDDPVTGTDYMRKNNLHGSACGYIFRSAILGELRFTPGIFHEDEEFTPQLMIRAERVFPTDARAYIYRKRKYSILTNNSVRQRLQRLHDARQVIFRLTEMADRMPSSDRQALQRRTAQLTMDYLYNVIRLTKSKSYFEHRVEELRRKGLFPLPARGFTWKYTWFRRLSNSRQGRSFLLRLIPLLPKER